MTRQQILRQLRLDREDKSIIEDYAKSKGIQDVGTTKQLRSYID